MANPKITLLIPHYKTLELTKLCLRLLRKYTDPQLAHFVVIDNGSADESTTYLRTLRWIELVERPKVTNEGPALAHARALDLGLTYVNTPYVLSIHTDTLVKRADWLPFLLSKIEKDNAIAGVGS
jgi:GT2 family glycosyltransferase